MDRSPTLALSLAAVALLVAALPATAGSVRSFTETVPAEDAERLILELAVGDVEVVGTSGSKIVADVELSCSFLDGSACQKAADAALLAIDRSGSSLSLELQTPGFRKNLPDMELVVRVPRHMALEGDFGVVDLQVKGLEGDLEIDAGVGDVYVLAPRQAVASVELAAGVGDVQLSNAGDRVAGRGMVGESLSWDRGSGPAHITVDCGVGDVDVTLD